MINSARRFSTIFLFALLAMFATAASATGWGQYQKPTILETLAETDGAQALVAAVLVVDEAGVLDFSIADLLGNKYAEIILLAPSNNAFERLLGLNDGTLDGLDVDTVKEELPGLLPDGVGAAEVAAILLKHVSLPKRANKLTASQNALLKRGDITVADESPFPVSIGVLGVRINYETTITKPDNFSRNGVIHYIDTVIVDGLLDGS